MRWSCPSGGCRAKKKKQTNIWAELAPWKRITLETLTVASVAKKFPPFVEFKFTAFNIADTVLTYSVPVDC
jgi:hypothetical protein